MTIIVKVTVVDDATGEIEKTFLRTYDGGYSWDLAASIKHFMDRIFKVIYGPDNDDW